MDCSSRDRSTLGLSGWLRLLWLFGTGVALAMAAALAQAQQLCGGQIYPFPYTDVAAVGAPFCPGIMEAYVTGVSKGTSPTTFSPNDPVIRLQMTTFLQRSLDQGLARSSRRAALNQWWTSQIPAAMQTVHLGGTLNFCAADGQDIWVPDLLGHVLQVEGNTGRLLGTWTGATDGAGVLVAAGKVFVTNLTTPGSFYVLDPTLPPGAVTVSANPPGDTPITLAFDGTHVWTANQGNGVSGGSVSIITAQSPYTVTTVTAGFASLFGILYDGAHIWVTDQTAGTLLKLDASGNILQTVTVGSTPQVPVFDGANIWVPNYIGQSISVVQASTGKVVATINADATNQLNGPNVASFDGERVLVTNFNSSSVSVFKAADLSFIANVSTGGGTIPVGACSDGVNFWVPLGGTGNLLRF
jgi:DNA-binding beta-propeller fold protein YncE